MPEHLTKAKIRANRNNALKSTGPLNTTSTRYNAVKHGLLAEGITELDEPDYYGFLNLIKKQLQPKGPIEEFLVTRIAKCIVRLERACRLEAEFITAELNPPITKTEGGYQNLDSDPFAGKTVVVDPGLPARLQFQAVDFLVDTFQRYETAIENKLYRAMNQLERIQRLRRGENVAAPANLDIAVHADKE